jgi:hypothetical protein
MADHGGLAFDDLFAIDRRVRELASEVRASSLAVNAARDEHPFHKPSRNVLSTLASWKELDARRVSLADEGLKAGLLRWMHAFLLARVSQSRRLAVAQARLAHREDEANFDQAWSTLVLGSSDASRYESLPIVRARARSVHDAEDARDELVAEAGRRSINAVGRGARASHAHGQGAERAFENEADTIAKMLVLTEGATADALKAFRFDRDGVTTRPGPLAFLDGIVARDAREGWPSRHLHTWVADAYREFLRLRRPRSFAMPELVGASSFLRIGAAFGASLADAMVPAATPFAMAEEPLGFRRRVASVVFALGMASTPFQQKILGLSGHEVVDQVRRLRRCILQHARIAAVGAERRRLGLRAGSREALEFAENAFGAALTGPVAATMAASGDGFDFEVFLQGVVMASAARDALDEDWFRNPRAPEWFEEHVGSQFGPHPRLVDAPGTARLLARLLGDHYA